MYDKIHYKLKKKKIIQKKKNNRQGSLVWQKVRHS